MNKSPVMKLEELGELYRLLNKYQQIYSAADTPGMPGILEEVQRHYESEATRINGTSGYCIVPPKANNVRGAGRMLTYTDSARDKILELRQSGMTIREIASQIPCSIGFVHKLINEHNSK